MSGSEQLGLICDELIGMLVEFRPEMATFLGIHGHDHHLGEYSGEAIVGRVPKLRRLLERTEALPDGDLDIEDRIDRRLLASIVKAQLLEIEDLRSWEKDPGFIMMPLYACHMLVTREFAPLDERAQSLLGRLKDVPRALSEGRANITCPPRVFVDVAMDVARGGMSFFGSVIPAVAELVPPLRDQLLTAAQEAVSAYSDCLAWLQDERESATGSFAIGEELFTRMLSEHHMLDYTASSLASRGEELLEQTEREMRRVARSIDPSRTWEEIYDDMASDHPRPEELIDAYRREMERSRAFVESTGVVDIPDGEQLVVEETPGFVRALIPYAAYMPPAPFETQQVGRFWVTPVDPSLPVEAQRMLLKDQNHYKIPVVALHEGYPGHHLQLVWHNRLERKARKLSHSTLFIEGWAFYCEELMEQLGFLEGEKSRLGRLKDQLWRAARIILDASLHSGQMTVDEAIDFMAQRVKLQRRNATAEVRRYTSTPTQPMSYLMGKLEILDIARAYQDAAGGEFDIREFHRQLLSSGSIPPALARKRLLGPGNAGTI